MIEFPRNAQHTIPSSQVKIIGLGGAGSNMLDRVALDGLDGAEMLALNADVRTLSGAVATERIQLGRNLTKGLGCGGDPDLGKKATQEAEAEIRMSIKGRKIIFLCAGLGGGVGSGGAPVVTRIAREEGAFVVVFATMPFTFEGQRRRDQAQTALNELAVLSNALVVFDNNRMGELVLAKQGIHEAFQAGDRMISDSIKAVIRLVIRPGLIHVGLDELMTALRTTRSRCLFGSGVASGKDRATKALTNALSSPLLDKGSLLRDAASVLVHICGGEDLTLFEVELLMQKLVKHVPEKAHVLFGAAIDSAMQDSLSITLISALPEEKLQDSPMQEEQAQAGQPILEPSIGFGFSEPDPAMASEPALAPSPEPEPTPVIENFGFTDVPQTPLTPSPAETILITDEEPRPQELVFETWVNEPAPLAEVQPFAEPEPEETPTASDFSNVIEPIINPVAAAARDLREAMDAGDPMTETWTSTPASQNDQPGDISDLLEKSRAKFTQNELLFEGSTRGRFADTDPTIVDGDDLDIPPFLRKKKKS
jgi:cell division protein FtsZ